MKRFSKVLALGMALSLAFGVTAFAADSPSVETAGLGKVTVSAEGLAEGQELQVNEEANVQEKETEIYTQRGLMSDVIEKSGFTSEIGKTHTISVVAVFDVSLSDGKVGEGGITVTFNGTFKSDKKYVVLHKNNGVWEALTTTVSEDGNSIQAVFSSLSPVAIVEVGETVQSNQPNQPNNDNNNNDNSSNDETKSPATGETLPIAGIMALICLAGASICVGKVRYNKQ